MRMPKVKYAEFVRGDVPIQTTPEVHSDERPHVLSKECWCNPEVEFVEAKIVHRRPDAQLAHA